METDTQTKQNDLLANAVLERITTEQVTPHSRLFYIAKEAGVWTLWLLTVVFGALAVAVTATVAVYRYATGYELTHNSLLGYAAEVLPYLWILVFSAMAFLAVYNLRHTKRGYRYSLVTIVGSSLVFSVGGGLILHGVGFGFSLDHLIGTYVPSYLSQDKVELRIWQRPEEGRLVGVVTRNYSGVNADGSVHFRDVQNGEWTLIVRELPPRDAELIISGEQVRLFGELITLAPPVFHVCGVLPWLKERIEERREMAHLRQEFRERMATYHLNNEAQPEHPRLCSGLPGMQRFRPLPPGNLAVPN
jgi:hypothetical protein